MSAVPVTPAWMNPRKIKFITVHTTASAFGKEDAVSISAYDRRQFGQISYHHVIERDGRDVQTLRYDQKGAHVGQLNTGNIGIAFIGGLDKAGKPADTRNAQQLASLEHRIRELLKLYPKAAIGGHRDWSPDANGNGRIDSYEWVKACPCFDVQEWLKTLGIIAPRLPLQQPKKKAA